MTAGDLAAKFDFALQHHRAGRVPKARQLYRKILKAVPDHADTLHMLGLLENQSGHAEKAVELLNRAAEAGAASAELYTNLGSALQASGKFAEAIAAYRRAIALNPVFALAHNNLGNALRAAGQPGAALDAIGEAIRIAPDFALAHYNLGDLLYAQGRRDEAVAPLKRALALDPGFAKVCNSLATIYMEQGDTEEAIVLFQRTLELDRHNASARHLLAALQGRTTPEPPAEYVVRLFDGIAGRFDQHLVGELDYQVPRQLADALTEYIAARRRSMDVIDLGCGTGLCGPLLRDCARHLKGVDLSTGMLQQAEGRRVYDELVAGDLVAGLGSRTAAWDLAIATDVFIYVGALESVFAASTRALRPGALFAFSIELEEGGEDYVLRPTGRYAHSMAYIRRLAEAAGLREMKLQQRVLRMDKGQPIDGCIVVLQKAA
jgi:predicted TPR repeat methyltransferase